MSRAGQAALIITVLLAASGGARGSHVDARDFPAPGQGEAAFSRMTHALVRGFDDICGDTFCEGEYYNLRALQLRCAVRLQDAVVSGCLWSFAGSWASVDGETGKTQVQSTTYTCALPLAEGTALQDLLAALDSADALDAPLPGTTLTVYDGLTECL